MKTKILKRRVDTGAKKPSQEEVEEICCYLMEETSGAFALDWLRRCFGPNEFDLTRSKKQLRNLADRMGIDCSIPK